MATAYESLAVLIVVKLGSTIESYLKMEFARLNELIFRKAYLSIGFITHLLLISGGVAVFLNRESTPDDLQFKTWAWIISVPFLIFHLVFKLVRQFHQPKEIVVNTENKSISISGINRLSFEALNKVKISKYIDRYEISIVTVSGEHHKFGHFYVSSAELAVIRALLDKYEQFSVENIGKFKV